MYRIFLKFIIISFLLTIALGQEQEFKLKDGSKIKGTILGETETEIVVQTSFGAVTINRDNIILKEFKVKMISGEIFKGTKQSETETDMNFLTGIGLLKLEKSKIASIEEVGKFASTGYVQQRRPRSLFGFLNSTSSDKNTDFSLGEEQLTDLFFDPTAYTLTQSTMYLSGFSFGFGLTDNLQVTSKWTSFLGGDLNLRTKYKVFENGNWEKQSAFSIGGHYHTRWKPNRKYEWVSGSFDITEYEGYHVDYYNYNSEEDEGWYQEGPKSTKTYYWGGYYPVGAGYLKYNDQKFNSAEDIVIEDNNEPNNYDNDCDSICYYPNSTNPNNYNLSVEGGGNFGDFEQSNYNMIELFSAYTYSSARNNLKGRISHTVGANIQIVLMDETKYFYRAYYGLDVDITPQLKVISEIFYDPWYIEPWDVTDHPMEFLFEGDGKNFRLCYQNDDYYNNNEECFSEDEITKSKKLPIILDVGFVYAINESFRFGIHFQQPWIGFYWKI